MFVDSREPTDIKAAAVRAGFIVMALDHGDFQSSKCVFERKDVGDLVNSTFARYGETPRLFDQMDRLFDYCQTVEKVPVLLICGKLSSVEQQFAERGQKLNRASIYGAVASVMVRYAVNVFWSEQPFEEVLEIIAKVSEKVEEGKLLLPMRRKLKEFSRSRSVASVANSLQVSAKVAEQLIKKFGGLYGILDAIKNQPQNILVMEGIGKATFEKMKRLGGVT